MNTLIHYTLPPLALTILYLSYRVGMGSHVPFFVPRLRNTLRRKRTAKALQRDNYFSSKL